MRGWDAAGFDQMEGSASFDSRAAKSVRRRGASKVLPQAADFFADGSVCEFEILKHGFRIAKKQVAKKRSAKVRSARKRSAKKRFVQRRFVNKRFVQERSV
jgi:hypothetical protein